MHALTALLLGRAFALANTPGLSPPSAALELCQLAGGDRRVLLGARSRCDELVREDPPSGERCKAYALLHTALAAFDTGCTAAALDLSGSVDACR